MEANQRGLQAEIFYLNFLAFFKDTVSQLWLDDAGAVMCVETEEDDSML